MHQAYRPVPNSQVMEICLNISCTRKVNNVCLLGLAVLSSVFLHSTPSFDLSFGWIGNRSAQLSEWRIKFLANSVGLERSRIRPKPKSSDVGKSEDSYLYLSATEGKMLANENTSGSFLSREHRNKKKIQKRALQVFFLCNN